MAVGRTAYPAALDIHASDTTASEGEFAYVNRLFLTALTVDVDAVATTFTVPSTSLLSNKGMLVIGTETCEWTAKPSGTTLTVVRGSGGSTASSHSAGDPIGIVPNAAQLNAILAALAQAEKKVGYRTGGANQVPANNTALLGVAAGQTEYKLITPAYTDQSVARRNRLANPGMERWTKGTASLTANGLQAPDGWIHVYSGGAAASQCDRESTIIAGQGSQYSCRIFNGFGSVTSYLEQKCEDWAQLRGVPCILSAQVRSALAGNGTASIIIRTDTGGVATNYRSPYIQTANVFEQLSIAVTIPLDATEVRLLLVHDASNSFVYFDNVYFGPGTVPPLYEPMNVADDLVRCMRRIEKHGAAGGPPNLLGYAATGTAGAPIGYAIPWAIPKGGTPTITKVGTWRAINCSQPTFDRINTVGYRMWTVPTAFGAWEVNPEDNTMYLIGEWNP